MRARLTAVVLAGLVALGACGDDKDSTDVSGGATTTTASGTATTADEGDDGDEGDGTSEGTGGSGEASAECVAASKAMAEAASAVPKAFSGTPQEIRSSVDALEAFAKAAPSEIRADLAVVVKGYAAMAAVLADANYDPSSGQPPSAETIQKLTAASSSLNQPEFQAASERVSTWFSEECSR